MYRHIWLFVVALVMLLPLSAARAGVSPELIPFQYDHNGILVHVRVDGTGPYRFLIDTDTTPSVIDLTVAKQLQLPLGRAASGTGIGSGRIAVYPVSIPQVDLGQESVQHLDALALDLSALSARVGIRIDGLLGTSFLNGRILQINYRCTTVSFLQQSLSEPVTARFRWNADGGNTIDDASVGATRVRATFDSGDGGFSILTANGILALNLKAAAESGQATIANGFRGQETGSLGVIDDVRMGSVSLGTLQTEFLPNQHSPFELNIGNRALEHYLVTMDYRKGTLTLSEPPACQMKP